MGDIGSQFGVLWGLLGAIWCYRAHTHLGDGVCGGFGVPYGAIGTIGLGVGFYGGFGVPPVSIGGLWGIQGHNVGLCGVLGSCWVP